MPRAERLSEISEWLDITVPELFGYEPLKSNERSGRIPLISRLVYGEDYMEMVGGAYVFASEGMDISSHFAFKIPDDELEPNVMKGDIVIVYVKKRPWQDDLAVVHLDQEDAICRRYPDHPEGVRLEGREPIHLSWYEAQRRLFVLGKVVEIRRRVD